MKKIIASVGMLAIGSTGLHAANYGDLTTEEQGKRWSLSAAVRGFYDDNYTTRPSGPDKRDSFGFEVSPSVSLNMPMETSYIGLKYIYTLSYYEDRPTHKVDQTHDVRLNLDHRFDERNHINLTDQFVYSIEPTLLDQGSAVTAPLRADAEGLHNRAALTFDTQLTPVWSLLLGYENNYYDYQDDGPGSYSSLLDRDEHLIRVDPRYTIDPNTTAFLGYQFGYVDYLSDELIAENGTIRGTDRDNYSHYVYVGADHKFSGKLSASGRVGAQFITYNKLDENTVSPYLDVSGTYSYLQGSYLKLGVKYAHNATDVGGTTADNVTLDQETATLYVAVNHRITAMLSAGLLVQYQHSTYNGGQFDGDADDYITAGLTVAYKLNRHWSVEGSYYFDNLSSSVDGRDFTRNRVLAGVRGTF